MEFSVGPIRVPRKLKGIDVIDVLPELFSLRRVREHIRLELGSGLLISS